MKKLVYIVWMLLFFSACQTDNLKVYEGEAGLYFVTSNGRDSILYSFNAVKENYLDVHIPVEALGIPVNQERKFSVRVAEDGTNAVEGVDYEGLLDEYVFDAGSCASEVSFRLLYKPELDNGSVRLNLELQTSSIFPDVLAEKKYMKVIWSNELFVPGGLDDWDWWYGRFFGSYSKTKHRYILNVCGLDELPDVTSGENIDVMWYYGMIMNSYFEENEVYDENGKLIETWIIGRN